MARDVPALGRPLGRDCDVIGAEILYAARREMALKLGDALIRRTEAGAAGHPGADASSAPPPSWRARTTGTSGACGTRSPRSKRSTACRATEPDRQRSRYDAASLLRGEIDLQRDFS